MVYSQFLTEGAIISLAKDVLLIGYGTSCRCSQEKLDPTLPSFYLPDFFLEEEKPWLQFEKYEKMKPEKLIQLLGQGKTPPLEWTNPHRELFWQEFNILQSLFADTKLSKAVPYVFAHAKQSMEIPRLTNSLVSAVKSIQRYPGYLYGFWRKGEGMVGVTPEILYRVEENHLETMALAGTSLKSIRPMDFKQSSKDIQEHRLVVEGIKSSLMSLGDVTLGEIRVLELAHLNHLMTPIHMQLHHRVSYEEIASALHPTPALGAFPKEAGRHWLTAFAKKMPRGRYGAPFGVVVPQQKKAQFLVAIRNIQWNSEEIRMGAGCGVIRESCPEKEWEEIELKMQAIRGTLDL